MRSPSALDERHFDVAIAVKHADEAHELQARIVVVGDFLDDFADGLFGHGERGADLGFDLSRRLPVGEQQEENERNRKHARDVADERGAQGLGLARSEWVSAFAVVRS